MPRGPDRAGSLSGMFGTPVPSEYLTVTGVDGAVACGARVSFAASADGVNVPEHISPLACAGRKPGCSPDSASIASSNCPARAGLPMEPVGIRFSFQCAVLTLSRRLRRPAQQPQPAGKRSVSCGDLLQP